MKKLAFTRGYGVGKELVGFFADRKDEGFESFQEIVDSKYKAEYRGVIRKAARVRNGSLCSWLGFHIAVQEERENFLQGFGHYMRHQESCS